MIIEIFITMQSWFLPKHHYSFQVKKKVLMTRYHDYGGYAIIFDVADISLFSSTNIDYFIISMSWLLLFTLSIDVNIWGHLRKTWCTIIGDIAADADYFRWHFYFHFFQTLHIDDYYWCIFMPHDGKIRWHFTSRWCRMQNISVRKESHWCRLRNTIIVTWYAARTFSRTFITTYAEMTSR